MYFKHILLKGVLSIGLTVSTAVALEPEGSVIVGQTFLASSQDATSGSNPWALISHGVAEKLFTVDKDDKIVPQIAESIKKVEGVVQEVQLGDVPIVWEVKLKDSYKFSDGTPVDATKVAAALTELNEMNPSASSSLGKMAVTPQDDLTLRIESERPTHVMDAVLAEWVFAIYHKDDNGNFVYTGPYKIDHFADDHIDLSPNRHYDAQSLDRPSIEIKKFADGHDLAKEAGELDIAFHLPIDTLPELRKADGVKVKSFEVGYHYMMFYNLDTIADVKVRKAIDTVLDRTALTQGLAGGTATRSLFPDYSPYFSDDSDPHGDEDAAAALLDEAGWKLNANGKREKDGEELSLTLVAYPHRPGLVLMQPLIEDQLNSLGIAVNTVLTGMDWDETQAILNERTFDLILWAQHTLPAGDPLWFLSAFFRSDGGNNHANLASEDVDEKLDALSIAEGDDRVLRSEDAHEAILRRQPVSNLVTPFWHVGLSDRMSDYKPYGADYYVIRSDLFVKATDTGRDQDADTDETLQDESGGRKTSGLGMTTLIAVLGLVM
ncbi:hypothetical protein ACHAWF_008448 [Thalassiosira exigua]